MASYKNRRKHSKYMQILKSELKIDCSDEPTKNLMIGNAGLVTGLQYEQVAELFSEYGQVENIVMIPRKSYCFVVYCTVESSYQAYNAINSKVKLGNMDGVAYLLFTQSVPKDYSFSKAVVSLPKGLVVLEDFVSPEEEEILLNCINWDNVSNDSDKILKHRRVKHYGYEFNYDTNNVDKNSPLDEPVPDECSFIAGRLDQLGHPLPWIPNQLTVNQYQQGQGIPCHIDTHSAFETPLLSLSLGSDVVMEFKHECSHVPVLLPRRSMLIMDGEARYAWSHCITPRTMDVITVKGGGLSVQYRGCRTSFTLRRVRGAPCDCSYPSFCDSKLTSLYTVPENDALQIERQFVHEVYNNIAHHFSDTRTKIWPNVLKFVHSFPKGSFLLDAGCGNGKNFGLNPNIFQVGFDRCQGLAEITHTKRYEVFLCDCLSVMLREGVCDGVISIAVLHHLSTRDRRLLALQQISRVLAPGGRALISVWAKDQTKESKTAYLKQDRKNRMTSCNQEKFACNNVLNSNASSNSNLSLPVHKARTEFVQQDLFVPWKMKTKQEIFYRYYHLFEENELFQLCKELPDINILQSYYTEGNWCIVIQRTSKKNPQQI